MNLLINIIKVISIYTLIMNKIKYSFVLFLILIEILIINIKVMLNRMKQRLQ